MNKSNAKTVLPTGEELSDDQIAEFKEAFHEFDKVSMAYLREDTLNHFSYRPHNNWKCLHVCV